MVLVPGTTKGMVWLPRAAGRVLDECDQHHSTAMNKVANDGGRGGERKEFTRVP